MESGDFEIPNVEQDLSAQDDYNALFINYAATAWHEMRKAWKGDHDIPLASKGNSKGQIKRWIISYPDLLSSKDPFLEGVPLSKMVKFFAGVWKETHTFVGKTEHNSDSSDGSTILASNFPDPPPRSNHPSGHNS